MERGLSLGQSALMQPAFLDRGFSHGANGFCCARNAAAAIKSHEALLGLADHRPEPRDFGRKQRARLLGGIPVCFERGNGLRAFPRDPCISGFQSRF